MLRSEAIGQIKRGLGFVTATLTLGESIDDIIIKELQNAQRIFEQGKTLPWFLEEVATIPFVSGTGTYVLPADFIRERDDDPLYYVDSATSRPVFIPKGDWAVLAKAWQGVDDDTPLAYATTPGNQFQVFPTPDFSGDFLLKYYKHDVVLDAEMENLWLEHAPEALIGKAGWIIAGNRGNAQAQGVFKAQFTDAWDALFREVVARDTESYRYRMGGQL